MFEGLVKNTKEIVCDDCVCDAYFNTNLQVPPSYAKPSQKHLGFISCLHYGRRGMLQKQCNNCSMTTLVNNPTLNNKLTRTLQEIALTPHS